MEDHKLHDYDTIKALSENPMQMAARILMLEKRAKEWKIGTEPQRHLGLVTQLKALVDRSHEDPEEAHTEADDLLLEFINDEEVSTIYGQITKYYAD